MEKIEPNMYVKTTFGIKKIHHIDENKTVNKYFYKLNDNYEYGYIKTTEIIGKPSYNITDLLEVGDVVAIKEYIDKFAQVFILGIYEPALLREIKAKLESGKLILDRVLTKEQFEQNSYKVGE